MAAVAQCVQQTGIEGKKIKQIRVWMYRFLPADFGPLINPSYRIIDILRKDYFYRDMFGAASVYIMTFSKVVALSNTK